MLCFWTCSEQNILYGIFKCIKCFCGQFTDARSECDIHYKGLFEFSCPEHSWNIGFSSVTFTTGNTEFSKAKAE